jgi:hypothetical protein
MGHTRYAGGGHLLPGKPPSDQRHGDGSEQRTAVIRPGTDRSRPGTAT